jgi:predicted phage terminase large subunit-like protein
MSILQPVPEAVIDRAIIDAAEDSLYEYVLMAFPHIDTAEFIDGRILKEVCLHLQACTEGTIKRLLINMPPSFMKSLLVGVMLPSWDAIKHPKDGWIYASYDVGLVIRDATKMHTLMTSDWYTDRWGQRIWQPKYTPMGAMYFAYEDEDKKLCKGGLRFSTSVKGKVTGRHGKYHVFDDPVNPEKAGSVSKKELYSNINWWESTMATRTTNAKELVRIGVMQRLHQMDLSGYLASTGDYVVLSLPMRFIPKYVSVTPVGGDWRTVEGELLWPEKADEEAVKILEKDLKTEYNISAQLQQRPIPQGGLMFKESWIRYWSSEGSKKLDPNGKPCLPLPLSGGLKFQSWDLNFKGGDGTDRVAGGAWWRHEGRFFLLGEDAETYTFVQTKAAIRKMSETWPSHMLKLIEAKANGHAAEDELSSGGGKDSEVKAMIGIKLVDPKGGKMSRANAAQPTIEKGNLIVPHPSEAPWVKEYIKEICSFPFAKFDDRVDQTTQAINYIPRSLDVYLAAMKTITKQEEAASLIAGM